MPHGTYRPGRKARIETDETAGIIRFFDQENGDLLEELPLAEGIGQCIRNTHPQRDRKTQYKELIDKVVVWFGDNEQAKSFLDNMMSLKPRYIRDQMSMVSRLQERYGKDELAQAVDYCMERELFTATELGDTLEYFAKEHRHTPDTTIKLPVKYSIVTAQKRPMDAYARLVKGGEAL